jgi:glycosyltransferase involved in cell wall biosynthesis
MSLQTKQGRPQRIAFLLDNLNGGGAEKVVLDIASGFLAIGHHVDLLVCELKGDLCASIPPGVNVVVLERVGKLQGLLAALRGGGWQGLPSTLYWMSMAGKIPQAFRYIPGIGDYLHSTRPAVLYSALGKSSIGAVLAASAPQVTARVFVGVHIAMSVRSELSRKSGKGQAHAMVPMSRYCFSRAHGVIAASHGVGADAIDFLGLDPTRVHVVYNPIAKAGSDDQSGAVPDHPWFRPGAPPVILGMGRLVAQKNFPLLIRAFAAVRQHCDSRLVILGGDKSSAEQMLHRQELQDLAQELGVAADVELLGFQSDPHAFLRSARLFVLSSNFEGFGNVVVEALLAGCPVVSTDCPSGPAEILDNGEYGALVPVNDLESLTAAILAGLTSDPEPEKLRQRGREFSLDRAVDGYYQVFFGEGSAGLANGSGDFSPIKSSS